MYNEWLRCVFQISQKKAIEKGGNKALFNEDLFNTEFYRSICKRIDKKYKCGVETFRNYVEMFGEDEETVELYIFDFIAFVLEEGVTNETNNEFYKVFDYLFRKTDDSDIIKIKGTRLKTLNNSVKRITFSNEIYNYLIALFYFEEVLIEATYRLNYYNYNNVEEQEMLMGKIAFSKQRLIVIKNLILDS